MHRHRSDMCNYVFICISILLMPSLSHCAPSSIRDENSGSRAKLRIASRANFLVPPIVRSKLLVDEIERCIKNPPSPQNTDLVITWVNYSETLQDPPFLRGHPNIAESFTELKYGLRSYFKNH